MDGWGRLAASIAGLAALGCATAPFEAGCSSQPGARTAAPLMWRAQPRAGGGVLYLLGSIHFESERAPRFPAEIEAARAQSDELVVEIDLDDVPGATIGESAEARGRLEPPLQLADVVSPSTLESLRRYLDERGLPFALVEGMKPWYVANLLVVTELRAAGYDAEYGVDRHFIARSDDKPIVALETLTEQLDLLDRLPLRIQQLMLEDALNRRPRFDRATDQLVEAWRRGDEQVLADLVFGPVADTAEFEPFYDSVLFQRNEAMARRLAELASDGKARFVVLGAGHMLGRHGIPSLLCERDFEVRRVSGGARSTNPN